MLEGMSLFGIGSSWGGFESLMIATYPEAARTAAPWRAAGPTLRIHAGLEDPRDLIADLEAGFARLARARREITMAESSGLPPDLEAALATNDQGLVPAIAQQHDTGEVLMMAWMNRQALAETLSTGRVCYWSRSRGRLGARVRARVRFSDSWSYALIVTATACLC